MGEGRRLQHELLENRVAAPSPPASRVHGIVGGARTRSRPRLPAARTGLADVSHAIRHAARVSGWTAVNAQLRERALWLVWSVVLLASLAAVVVLNRRASAGSPADAASSLASGFNRTANRTDSLARFGFTLEE